MINFTVGPVQSPKEVLEIGAQHIPYFRTPEFSQVMLENERLVKVFAGAPEDARVAFMTGSGTASMEACVMNVLSPNDKALVVNGGSFGQRFAELCQLHGIPHDVIRLSVGKALTQNDLAPFEGKGYTAFLVNKHETSTGVHYDLELISAFCKANGMLLIVDNISSFLADPFDMSALGADVMIAGSQKAFACPPGISLLVLSPRALQRINENPTKCMYLDLKSALKDQERGQTPFTPAVGVLLQLHARLKAIEAAGGVASEVSKVATLAADFREKIKDLPFEIVSESLSNAVTPLHPLTASAYTIFEKLKDEYGIWVCPNGGALRDEVFRVGHIGVLTTADNDCLINALRDLKARDVI